MFAKVARLFVREIELDQMEAGGCAKFPREKARLRNTHPGELQVLPPQKVRSGPLGP